MSTSARERERKRMVGRGIQETKRKGREETRTWKKKRAGGGLNLGRMGYFI
jgi:hypothetical protein